MQQGVVLFRRVWQSLHARLWKMEGWNLIWTPPHFCSGRIPKSFATCHIPSDNVGQHATHQMMMWCTICLYACVCVCVYDCVFVCVCFCDEGLSCRRRRGVRVHGPGHVYMAKRAHKRKVSQGWGNSSKSLPLPNLLAAAIYSFQCIQLDWTDLRKKWRGYIFISYWQQQVVIWHFTFWQIPASLVASSWWTGSKQYILDGKSSCGRAHSEIACILELSERIVII